MEEQLKQEFVVRCAREYLQEVQHAMHVAMVRAKMGKSGDLSRSLGYSANSSGQGASGTLKFMGYGRFVDMGVGRGQPLGKLSKMKVALTASRQQGLAIVKSRTRKPKKFYSPIIWGKLTYLQNKLMYGFDEGIRAQLKADLEAANKSI